MRNPVSIYHTEFLNIIEKEEIISLWNNEYPRNLKLNSLTDFEIYLSGLKYKNHILLKDKHLKTVAWFISFTRENEKWFAMIIDTKYKGKGHGTALLNAAKHSNTVLNGWVIDHDNYKKTNGKIYTSPLLFYVKNGFETQKETRLVLDKINAVKVSWKGEWL